MSAAARAFEAGHHETAVSRAYYVSYHAVIAAFEAKMEQPRPRWSHNFRPYFARYPELGDLDQQVLDLYEVRVRADYGETGFELAEAQTALATAEAVFSRVVEVIRDAQI